jgi:hypothetical protein
VISFLGDGTQIDDISGTQIDAIQMQEEYFAHYAEAPIFNWVSSWNEAYLTESGG